jgi:hypothetical protein
MIKLNFNEKSDCSFHINKQNKTKHGENQILNRFLITLIGTFYCFFSLARKNFLES